jgi:hypothetical protein
MELSSKEQGGIRGWKIGKKRHHSEGDLVKPT